MAPKAQLAADAQVLARIEDWRRRLIDLTYRNRLISYKPTKASTLQIEAPSIYELVDGREEGARWGFYLPPEPPESDEADVSDAADFVDETLLEASDVHPR